MLPKAQRTRELSAFGKPHRIYMLTIWALPVERLQECSVRSDFKGVKTFATILLHFFLQKGKFYAVFCIYEGRAGGLKLFFLWDFPFPKSSNYNTICSKLWLNNSQLPQSCRHCFPNQHQQVWSQDLCHLESLYSSLNINKQHIFQALEEKGYVQIVAIAAMRMCLDANRRS